MLGGLGGLGRPADRVLVSPLVRMVPEAVWGSCAVMEDVAEPVCSVVRLQLQTWDALRRTGLRAALLGERLVVIVVIVVIVARVVIVVAIRGHLISRGEAW